jgi:hypothetical protein
MKWFNLFVNIVAITVIVLLIRQLKEERTDYAEQVAVTDQCIDSYDQFLTNVGALVRATEPK